MFEKAKKACKTTIYFNYQDFEAGDNGIEIVLPITKEELILKLGCNRLTDSGIFFIQLEDIGLVKLTNEVGGKNGKE